MEHKWKYGRVAYGYSLENCRGVTAAVGSNPTASSINLGMYLNWLEGCLVKSEYAGSNPVIPAKFLSKEY